MKRRGPISQRWVLIVACGLAGCSIPLPTSDRVISSETADEGTGTLVFENDADPALAALPIVETELLIQPYPGADARMLSDLYAQAGAEIIPTRGLEEIQLTVLKVPSEQLIPIADNLAASGLIEGIHKNYIFEAEAVPDDPFYVHQPHLAQIGAPDAWDVTVGGEEITIAVVDTGVQADHPDLADNILEGWNIYDDDEDFRDILGHGTLVAGVVAAVSDNGTGIAGVAWDSPLLAIRATNEKGEATGRHIAAGILWAVGRGAKVINVSFAPLWANTVVRSAAKRAFNRGALVIISAGNGGELRTAAGYREALFVGAIDPNDEIAWFSDHGPFVDIVAPGTGIRSTSYDSGYQLADGTSFAAPIVAGVAALAWSVNPNLRPVSIIDALVASAVDLGARGKDDIYGEGAVDAAGAVDEAAAASFVPDTTPPTLSIERPSPGTTLSGRYIARATATDEWGVADVVMFVDDMALASDTHAPYRFVIDTAALPSGPHELAFVATDLAGNSSDAETVKVRFGGSSGGDAMDSLPSVVFKSPTPGATVSGDVIIRATVTASAGLATIEWLVDGASVFVTSIGGRSSGLSYNWRTQQVTSGRHTVSIIVTDQAGAQATGSLQLIKR